MDTNSSVVKAWVGVGVGVGAGAGRRAAKWGEMGDISSTVNNKKKSILFLLKLLYHFWPS